MDKETRDAIQHAANERKEIYDRREKFEREVISRLIKIETKLSFTFPLLSTLISLAAVSVAIWAVLQK